MCGVRSWSDEKNEEKGLGFYINRSERRPYSSRGRGSTPASAVR